ncbi:MAG: TIM-barrel domain-containing protein, partial [Flammeovirgaceae bacterium]
VDPNEELCARWMQIGTLYPFARSHSHESYRKKEPWRFGEIMLKTSEVSIKFRYKLLKFYYSLFIRSKKTGLLFRPLFFEFSDDKSILDSEKVLNSQFLIGSEIMVTPSFEDGSSYEVYFPKGCWYDLRNDSKQIEGSHFVTSEFK